MEASAVEQLTTHFHFLRPLWLLALLPALLFVVAAWRLHSTVSAWDRAIDSTLLPYLLERRNHGAQRTPLWLLLAAWLLSVVALAGPVWQQLPQPVQQRQDALVIVMDLSLSMFAPDHSPSRLDLAKRKLRDILASRNEGQTALVVYAGDAHTVTPLTDDVVTIAALVPSLNPNIMPLFGSNPVTALDIAIGLLDEAEAIRGRILLMTDGINGFSEEQVLAERMAETGYELLILGIGTAQGAPIRTSDGGFLTDQQGAMVVPRLNRNVLQSLANRTGGRYHDIQLADSDIAYLLSGFDLLDDSELSEAAQEFDVWVEAGPWLLLLILPIAAMSFRRGWLFCVVLVSGSAVLLPVHQARALDWQDLWKTRDQQAAAAFAAEEHALAASLFRQPQWSGAASYRAEDYQAAITSFSTMDNPDGHYNRGNALAHHGDYQAAIAAYDEALELDPDHEDAAHNRQIIEQLLQQQESANGEPQQGENQEQQTGQNARDQSQDEENSEQPQEQSEQGDEQQQEPQQNQAPQEQQGSESNSEQNTPSESSNEELEQQQSLEQWLRRIEDDPGELLRRKFRYQFRQRQLNGTANDIPNGGQIW